MASSTPTLFSSHFPFPSDLSEFFPNSTAGAQNPSSAMLGQEDAIFFSNVNNDMALVEFDYASDEHDGILGSLISDCDPSGCGLLSHFGPQIQPKWHGKGIEEEAFNKKVRPYSAEERKMRVLRYLKRRNTRNFKKTVKYACRKTLADKRARVRGRFVKDNHSLYNSSN